MKYLDLMKYLALFMIRFYQIVLSPLLHQLLGVRTACRFDETCSHYAARVINKYGILYGSQLALKRLLKCQPFAK